MCDVVLHDRHTTHAYTPFICDLSLNTQMEYHILYMIVHLNNKAPIKVYKGYQNIFRERNVAREITLLLRQ